MSRPSDPPRVAVPGDTKGVLPDDFQSIVATDGMHRTRANISIVALHRQPPGEGTAPHHIDGFIHHIHRRVHTEMLHGERIDKGLLIPRLGLSEAGRYGGLESPRRLQANIHLCGQELAARVMALGLLKGQARPRLRIFDRKVPRRPGNPQVGSVLKVEMIA